MIRIDCAEKKMFIIFDDVDDSEQLKFLTEDYMWFGPGSKLEICKCYNEVERVNYKESLQLFKSNALTKQ